MEGRNDGSEEARRAQVDKRSKDQPQEPEAQTVATAVDVSAYETQIAERDERIKALEAQVADAAKTAEMPSRSAKSSATRA